MSVPRRRGSSLPFFLSPGAGGERFQHTSVLAGHRASATAAKGRARSQLPLNVLSVHIGTRAICENTPGLNGQQKRLCRDYPDVMVNVARGAHLAVKECQKQFRNNRWNCTTLPRDASVFGKATVQGHLLLHTIN